MICFDAHVSDLTLEFFHENKKALINYTEANMLLKRICGVNNFFLSQSEASELLVRVTEQSHLTNDFNRREYGDFQTNIELSAMVLEYAISKCHDIEFVLEPTCGKGNFIIATLRQYSTVKKIVGVEIFKPYIWDTKFGILEYFLENKNCTKPEIDIIHANAFEFSYEELASATKTLKTLVVGNPPWVTNSELGSIESNNLPIKSNFKKHTGLEAMTGKGNFDIGEYISLIMLKCFQNHNGLFCFLIKNSIVKNIIQDQKQNRYRFSESEMLKIDAKKEFNVSVKASLFLTHLNTEPDLTCKEIDFYSRKAISTIGWYKNKFVYSVNDYDISAIVEGKSKFVWRSGIKHDCSKVMELEMVNNHYTNGLGEIFNLEKNLIYGLLKSSDLKGGYIRDFRKLTIITQNKIGQETDFIKQKYPLTYQYLLANKKYFVNRKSSIYKDKPDFSIFGIGDYSFAMYKVAVSGLYKTTHFTLVEPNKSKPIMLDDTCYFIGFDKLIMAQIAHFLLNSNIVQRFLKSIIFTDAKRAINKDTLMRIDLLNVFNEIDFNEIKNCLRELSIEDWEDFGALLMENETEQVAFV